MGKALQLRFPGKQNIQLMAQIRVLDCGKRYYTAALEEQERNFANWGPED